MNKGKNIRLIISTVLAFLLCGGIVGGIFMKTHNNTKKTAETMESITGSAVTVEPAVTPRLIVIEPTDGVYTFLQGPKSWSEKRTWSGVWGETYVDGRSFGGFGCGHCCMANIYSTYSSYECSPMEMYKYARKKTDYGGGAIDWHYMEEILENVGFSCELQRKPSTYEEFETMVKSVDSCIMLISSYEDDSHWQNTPGHYVTTFLHNEKEGKVFLGDSGNPENNRTWISLKTIYKALKTASNYQFMTATSYEEANNTWRKNGIKDDWVSPLEVSFE